MVLLFTSLYLTLEKGFSIAEAGFIMSFFGFGSVSGSFAGGYFTDKRNFYDIMLFALLSSGVVLLFIPLVDSAWAFSAIIFLYAFTSDMYRPANAAAIATYSKPENRSRAVALVRLGINLGFSVGPAVGGFVALYLGYKWLFYIDAATTFMAGMLVYILLPRPDNIDQAERKAVLADSSTSAYRDWPYLIFILLCTFFAIGFFQLFVSVPPYLKTVEGYNEDSIGLLLALNGLMVVFLEMPLVAWLEKTGKPLKLIRIGLAMLPISFLSLWLGNGHFTALIMYTIFISFSEIMSMPFMMTFTLSRPVRQRQGQYSALYSVAYGIALIAAPSLGLGVADRFGFDNMFMLFVILGCFTFIAYLILEKKLRRND